MKVIGKILCCILTTMLAVMLLLVYLMNPFLINTGNYAVLFIMIIVESSLYYTQLLIASGMAVFYTLASVEKIYSRLMERMGIE